MPKSQAVVIPSDGLILHGIERFPTTPRLSTAVLFLHGGGTADSTRYGAWQEFLATYGIASMAFDYRGCGQSQGRFEDGSLINRLRDAENAYDTWVKDLDSPQVRIVIAGSSMGGHVACRLSGTKPSAGLILQSAAAYGPLAETLPLNDEFTNEIRKPGSYEHSPAFADLAKYPKPVLCIYGGHDEVVPEPVKQAYLSCARKNGRVLVIGEYGHTMLSPRTDEEQKGFKKLLEASRHFVSSL